MENFYQLDTLIPPHSLPRRARAPKNFSGMITFRCPSALRRRGAKGGIMKKTLLCSFYLLLALHPAPGKLRPSLLDRVARGFESDRSFALRPRTAQSSLPASQNHPDHRPTLLLRLPERARRSNFPRLRAQRAETRPRGAALRRRRKLRQGKPLAGRIPIPLPRDRAARFVPTVQA